MAGQFIVPLVGLLALGLAAGCGSAEAPQAAFESTFESAPELIVAEATVTEPAAGTAQETPPPLAVEQVEVQASAEAEAAPVFEAAAFEEPAGLELVAEPEPDEPASRIALQPLTVAEMPCFEAPPEATVAHEEEPAAIAPRPELVMKPMGTATMSRLCPASAIVAIVSTTSGSSHG